MAGRKYIQSDIDRRIGKIITLTRNRFGLSQKDLARQCGITFQQIQKYETAGNRIPIARIYQIAQCFEMSVGALIDGADQKYIHDDDIRKTIELMYKMSPNARKFVLQAARYATGAA